VEGSPTGFSERLIELLHKPTLREAMGAKGRAFIRLHYSSAAAAARLSQVVAAAVTVARSMGTLRTARTPGGGDESETDHHP